MYIIFAIGDWTFLKRGKSTTLKNAQLKGGPVLDETLCLKGIHRMKL
jgi:hypothetical protein